MMTREDLAKLRKLVGILYEMNLRVVKGGEWPQEEKEDE